MLEAFGEGLWLAEGGCVRAAGGFAFPTRMAVIALPGGGVALWSPVAPTAELRQAVAERGEVRALIAPNTLHHLFIADWQKAFPEARLYLAPGLARKRPDLAGEELDDQATPLWAEVMDQAVIRGNLITTEVWFHHRPSRTVLLTDLMQNFAADWFRGWRGVIARADGMVGPQLAVPLKYRLAFINRRAARAGLVRALDWPSERLVAAHGTPMAAGAQAALRQAFGFVLGR